MKFSFIIIVLLSLSSCGGQSETANDKLARLIKQKISSTESFSKLEVNNVEFVQDVFVEDSLRIANKMLKGIDEFYYDHVSDLRAGEKLAEKPRSKLYYASGKINKYQKGELKKLVKKMKQHCEGISQLRRGWNGDLIDNPYAYLFRPILSLKGREPSEAIGKIYKAKVKYSFHHSQHESKSRIDYILLDENEEKVLAIFDESDYHQNFKLNNKPEMKLDIQEYVVTDDGIVKEKGDTSIQEEEPENDGNSTVLKYLGGEFLGSCLTIFEDKNGEEIMIWNADLGQYANPENSCVMRDELIGKSFKISFELGIVKVYQEEVGESQLENEMIITSIELVD